MGLTRLEGFVGGSYTSQSVIADSERTVNLYPETIESLGKSRSALYPTPGLKPFSIPTAAQSVGISSVSVSRAGATSGNVSTTQILDYDVVGAPSASAVTGSGGTGSADFYCSPSTLSASISNHTVGTSTQNAQTPAGGFGGTATGGNNVTLSFTLNVSTIPDPPNGGSVTVQYSVNGGTSWINIGFYAATQITNIGYVVTGLTNLSTLMVRLISSATYVSGLTAITTAALSSIKANIAGGGTWTITSSGGNVSDASITALAGTTSNFLVAQNESFGLPVGRTITGIRVSISITTVTTAPSANPWSLQCQLIYQGAPIGSIRSITQTADLTSNSLILGGVSDLWGATITDAMVSDPTFGYQIRVFGTATSNVSFDLNSPGVTINSTGDYYAVTTLSAASPFNVGDAVIHYGLTQATFLNGQPLTVQSVAGNVVTCIYDSHPTPFPATSDTGKLYNQVPSYALITTSAANPFSVGANVTFNGLTANSWLNGQTLTIQAEPSSTTFQVPFSRLDQATVSDTGTAFIGGTVGTPAARALYSLNGARQFAVVQGNLYEIFSDGSFISRGNLVNDSLPASITANVNQLLIASAGLLYVMDLGTNIVSNVPNYSGGGTIPAISVVDYCDGYFIALVKNSQKFLISSILDGTQWNALDVAVVSVFPDNVLGMKVVSREIALFGAHHSVVYYDSGNPNFPFDVVPGSFIDNGCGAALSLAVLDNGVFWIGEDDRGGRMAWRSRGYVPQRISTHAVEYAWSQYSKVSDAIAYTYQDQGHNFWVIYFPTANATWVYDVTTGLWHERGFLNSSTGNFDAHRSQNHAYCFGKHLVGDWKTGVIYDMSIAYGDDFGNPIRRLRRAPVVSNQMQWLFISSLLIDMEVGLALQSGQGSDPQVLLRWSDDGTKTWSSYVSASAGKVGDYRKRVIFWRLGRTRQRIFEVTFSDPIPLRMVDAYMEIA